MICHCHSLDLSLKQSDAERVAYRRTFDHMQRDNGVNMQLIFPYMDTGTLPGYK